MAPRVQNVPLAAGVLQRVQVESVCPCFGLLGHPSLFPKRVPGTSMMRGRRKLMVVLDHLGLYLRTDWIPSVAKTFADALSRRFPHSDLQIRRELWHSVRDLLRAPVDSFPYRPVGEHPVQLRRQSFAKLASQWSREDIRLLCPPVNLIIAAVRKLRLTKAPAVLLIPD